MKESKGRREGRTREEGREGGSEGRKKEGRRERGRERRRREGGRKEEEGREWRKKKARERETKVFSPYVDFLFFKICFWHLRISLFILKNMSQFLRFLKYTRRRTLL